MAIWFEGNNFDVQSVGTASTYTVSGVLVSNKWSQSVDVVNGLNIGTPISGTAPVSGMTVFTIPTNYALQTKQFTVVNNGAAGSVVKVSGVGTSTINGSTNALTVVKLTGQTFYNISGNNWISY